MDLVMHTQNQLWVATCPRHVVARCILQVDGVDRATRGAWFRFLVNQVTVVEVQRLTHTLLYPTYDVGGFRFGIASAVGARRTADGRWAEVGAFGRVAVGEGDVGAI